MKIKNQTEITISSISYDMENRVLSLKNGEQKLSNKEDRLLRLMIENQNKVLERDNILVETLGDKNFFNRRLLEVYIEKFIKFFKEDENIEIERIKGIGFKFSIKNET